MHPVSLSVRDQFGHGAEQGYMKNYRSLSLTFSLVDRSFPIISPDLYSSHQHQFEFSTTKSIKNERVVRRKNFTDNNIYRFIQNSSVLNQTLTSMDDLSETCWNHSIDIEGLILPLPKQQHSDEIGLVMWLMKRRREAEKQEDEGTEEIGSKLDDLWHLRLIALERRQHQSVWLFLVDLPVSSRSA